MIIFFLTQALGGSLGEPDSLLIRQLETLFSLFTFYHGSLERVRMVSSSLCRISLWLHICKFWRKECNLLTPCLPSSLPPPPPPPCHWQQQAEFFSNRAGLLLSYVLSPVRLDMWLYSMDVLFICILGCRYSMRFWSPSMLKSAL